MTEYESYLGEYGHAGGANLFFGGQAFGFTALPLARKLYYPSQTVRTSTIILDEEPSDNPIFTINYRIVGNSASLLCRHYYSEDGSVFIDGGYVDDGALLPRVRYHYFLITYNSDGYDKAILDELGITTAQNQTFYPAHVIEVSDISSKCDLFKGLSSIDNVQAKFFVNDIAQKKFNKPY